MRGTIPFFILILVLSACHQDAGQQEGTARSVVTSHTGPLFEQVDPAQSGVAFSNDVSETPELNYFTYIYAYNGGGVAIGDVDNDGLSDIYFTGNMVPDRLYKNLGDMRFEDITESALGPDPGGWRTGVTMADVNGDGLLDIYVCRSGPTEDPALTRNLLYMNQGGAKFIERAVEFGVADTTHNTQAAFFDLENDGDLDLFVAAHPRSRMRGVKTSEVQAMIRNGRGPSSRLYRNDNGRFVDITGSAGLHDLSYTLGVSVADIDRNGAPDIYLANDFDIADALLMNSGKGAFLDEIQQRTRHISNFGMGCDVADMNNDGLPEIMVLDMTASDHVRSKSNMGSMAPMTFWAIVASGNHYQYMVNTLQLNNGNGTFSEIAQLAGVARTDWSWAPLFADLDNDGWKDLLITNGFKHDIRNNDFQKQVYQKIGSGKEFYEQLNLVPSARIRNYLFRNNGAGNDGRALLTFSDSSTAWGFNEAVNSNGAAYADLDNDGDLDLVINNIDAVASIYRNTVDSHSGRHFLRFDLRTGKRQALGATVHLKHHGTEQVQELQVTRGYQSAVEPLLHFGLGAAERVDTVLVHWPNGKRTMLTNVAADQVLTLYEKDAQGPWVPEQAPGSLMKRIDVFTEQWRHQEKPYDDFKREVLLPHKYSELGPFLSVADANGDGLDDLFVSGAEGQSSELFIQREDGSFIRSTGQPWVEHAAQEQMGSRFFDADGDGDLDLIVLAGSNEHDVRSTHFAQRLYLNNGRGKFTFAVDAFPEMTTSAQRVDAADIDADGDMDLFIGGRQTPAHYPFAPRSYLLVNDGSGHFIDATSDLAPVAMGPGMVTDVRFADIDGDADPDLILVGEWMPLTILLNTGGHFSPAPPITVPPDTEGWWHSLAIADLDNDGDLDMVCGNQGWNSKFQADPTHPLHVYWGDMDDNGRSDIVLAKEKGGTQLPVRGRECSSQQCANILQRFPTYEKFARADLSMIYTPEKLQEALHLQARHMRTSIFINDGQGRFSMKALPVEAQFAPVNGIVVMDVDGDGISDLVIAGNDHGAEVETVRYDAGIGAVFLGDGKGGFVHAPVRRSGFFAGGNVKDLAGIRLGKAGIPGVVVANNNDAPEVYSVQKKVSGLASK